MLGNIRYICFFCSFLYVFCLVATYCSYGTQGLRQLQLSLGLMALTCVKDSPEFVSHIDLLNGLLSLWRKYVVHILYSLLADSFTVCTMQISVAYFLELLVVFLLQCHIQLDRKVLSEMAIYEPRTFKVCIILLLNTCILQLLVRIREYRWVILLCYLLLSSPLSVY